MNIKYIVNVRIPTPRAHGYAIMKMCEQFSLSGVKLELIIPNRKNNELEEDPFVFYGVKNVFPIRRVFSFDLLGSYLSFGRLFYWVDLLSFFISLKFSKTIKRGDIVYTRDFTIASLFSRKNFICLELHDIPPKSKFWLKMALKKARLVFVLNENIKKELVDLGADPSIVHISPSGVDLKEFDINVSKEEARNIVGLPVKKDLVMYTGHLYPWKGVDTVADAGKLMRDKLFVFVGGVDPELSEYKKKYESFENIIFLPFIQRKQIPFYIKSADVLVMPYSDKEDVSLKYTSPLKLFEYMASRVPIVSSDLPSIRQVLDGSMCVFAKSGDSDSFTEAIEKVLDNEKLSEGISSKAFEEVSKYSWENRTKNIIEKIICIKK